MDGETTRTARHDMPFGADFRREATTFSLYAPLAARIDLEIEGAGVEALARGDDGWHRLVRPGTPAGTRYRYRLEDGTAVPDPASRFQPDGVHGWSEVIDPAAFVWAEDGWRGRPFDESVVYELHVGAFTAAGTFVAAIDRLDHLAALGVTAIQLMPIAAFAGDRNWGYDGVLLYAPDRSYGRPEDLKLFVEAAHRRGIQVFLDVIYNHFGPEGNYLPRLVPLFTERHLTPWGAGIDYDGGPAEIRDFALHNALYWLEEYRLDGLRLDAVHAIVDDSPVHLADAIAASVADAFPDREVHLILENEANEAHRLVRDGGRPRRFTAQWNDDVHHVLHVAVTGENEGYYADYAGDGDKLGRALAEGFAFQGEAMAHSGRRRGEPSAGLPPSAFVAFLQNHDQIGNRAFGDRLAAGALPEAVRAATAVVMLSPQIPMLFMGEEWGATTPFPFFVGFTGDLAAAVREGRSREFAHFTAFNDPLHRDTLPDPTAPETFASAKLDWSEPAADHGLHAVRLHWMRRLIAVRRLEIVPRLSGMTRGGTYERLGATAVRVRWRLGDGARLVLCACLGAERVAHAAPAGGRVLWSEGIVGPTEIGPHAAEFTLYPPE